MSQSQAYDAIVIGSGQGGKPLALALAAAGRRTAVIEQGPVGGTCVNYGCTPTKTLVASAAVAWLCRRAGDFGVRTGPVEVDLARVRERKRAIVEQFRASGAQALEEAPGLHLIRGEAAFLEPRVLRVRGDQGDHRLRAEQIFIDTGLRPVRPPVAGLDAVPALDNVSAMELDAVPRHLLVLGGGYVGAEFAQMFRRFGAEVTVIDRGAHILETEDADIAAAVTDVFRGEGIQVLTGAAAVRAWCEAGEIRLELEAPGRPRTVAGSHLLVAAGRAPNTESLALDRAGVATDEAGFIRVDERLETSAPGVYAIGDVKGGPAFTHVSYHDYLVLKTNLLDGGRATTAGRPLLYAVFIDPQLGRIGLNETEARAQGREVRVAKLPLASVARAMETDDTRGLMKALVDPETGRILGATIFGMQGGELMSMLQIAMLGGVDYRALRDGMFAHPLLAESFNTLFASLEP